MDESSADRICAAVGSSALNCDSFQKAALIRGLEVCAKWHREAVELSTNAHLRKRNHQLGLTVSAIKRLDNLISDDDFWCWLSAPIGANVQNDRTVVRRLRRIPARKLWPSPEPGRTRSGRGASGGNGHAYRVWLRMNSFVGGYPMPHFKQAKPISLSL
jgi:hypothetical protein